MDDDQQRVDEHQQVDVEDEPLLDAEIEDEENDNNKILVYAVSFAVLVTVVVTISVLMSRGHMGTSSGNLTEDNKMKSVDRNSGGVNTAPGAQRSTMDPVQGVRNELLGAPASAIRTKPVDSPLAQSVGASVISGAPQKATVNPIFQRGRKAN